MKHEPDSPINAALRSFETAEANLEKIERIFRNLRQLGPDGISFDNDLKYDELCRAYGEVLTALPSIDGWKPQESPIDLNELAQWRLDAREIDEISAIVGCMLCQKVCPQNKESVNWVEDGPQFSEEEIALVLKGVALDQLPAETAAKWKHLGFDEDYDIYPRNLRVLLI